MFIDKYKQSDIIENCSNFLKKIEKLKLYMVEFDKDSTIKPKIYLSDYTVKGENQQLIIVITYVECIFSQIDSI